MAELAWDKRACGRAYWIAWSEMPRVGPTLIPRLEKHFGSLAAAWDAAAVELEQVPGLGPKSVEEIVVARSQFNPQAAYDSHVAINPKFWTPGDQNYPTLLRELPSPPSMLYYRGEVELKENRGVKPAIAIVGTRHPSDYGIKWTKRLSKALTQRGFTIVSGLADGIDTAAHQACLEAGGRTIAVVGTGVDRVYPARNRSLCQRIVEQGLVVSEYPSGTRPDRSHFPQRNRIIAGLCRATIVVEAPKRSGALITAYAANEYCRDVYVVPGSLDNPKVRGGLELIGQGAQVILDEHHLLELLGDMPLLDAVPVAVSSKPDLGSEQGCLTLESSDSGEVTEAGDFARQNALGAEKEGDRDNPQAELAALIEGLAPELAGVYQQVSTEAQSFDGLVMRCELAPGAVSSALLQLELMGLVIELPGKQYQRC